MASFAAATAARHVAKHPDALLVAAIADRYPNATAAATVGLWNVKNSSRDCSGPKRSHFTTSRPTGERAARALKTQEQRKNQIQSIYSNSALPPPRRETETAAAGRGETSQQVFDAAAAASNIGAATAGRTADTPIVADLTENRLPEHAAAGHSLRTEAANSSKVAVFSAPAETTFRKDEGSSLNTYGVLLGSVPGLRTPAGTAAWRAIQRSTATVESLPQAFIQDVYRCTNMREKQGIRKASTLKMVDVKGKLLPVPPWSPLSAVRCMHTARPTTVPYLHPSKLRSSSYCRNRRISLLASLSPMTYPIERHMPLPNEEATPPPAAAAAAAYRVIVASECTTHHGLVPTSAAVAVSRAALTIAAPSDATAAAASGTASRHAPLLAFSSLLKFVVSMDNHQTTAGTRAPWDTIYSRSTANVRTMSRWAAASGGIAVRYITCASAGAAAPWASAVTGAGSSRTVSTSAAFSATGSSEAVGKTLPLGSLYSKTHEYVRLLLEYVGPRDVSSGAAETAVPGGVSKEGGTCSSGSRTPRRCRLVGFVGVSTHAAEELGEVVYCEYTRPVAAAAAATAGREFNDAAQWRQKPQQQQGAPAGRKDATTEGAYEGEAGSEQEKLWVRRGSPLCSLESVKSVAEAYSPVEGIILAVNPAASQNPALVWREPEEDGWLVKLLLPLPMGPTSRGSSNGENDKSDTSSALFLTDADVGTAAWKKALGGPVGAAVEQAEDEAAENYRAGGLTVAALQAAEDAYAFMEACKNCTRMQDALVGLQRRLMGPQQYMQFVEREKETKAAES